MSDCIFCKVIKGELPSYKLYEDDDVFVILDVGPINKGHVLIIAKEHAPTLLEASEELLCKIMKVAKKIAPAVVNATNADGFNFYQNNGEDSGQMVPHLHFHIIPRFKGDGLFNSWPNKKYKEGEADEMLEKIKNEIK
ncbi:HIT family protein [Nanoarchaeota archaeon]